MLFLYPPVLHLPVGHQLFLIFLSLPHLSNPTLALPYSPVPYPFTSPICNHFFACPIFFSQLLTHLSLIRITYPTTNCSLSKTYLSHYLSVTYLFQTSLSVTQLDFCTHSSIPLTPVPFSSLSRTSILLFVLIHFPFIFPSLTLTIMVVQTISITHPPFISFAPHITVPFHPPASKLTCPSRALSPQPLFTQVFMSFNLSTLLPLLYLLSNPFAVLSGLFVRISL